MLLRGVSLLRFVPGLYSGKGFWFEFSQGDIPNHLENHTTATLIQSQRKQKMQPLRRGFQGRSLLKYCNQVSCGENKAFNEMVECGEGTFQTLRDKQVSTGTETEESRTGKPNSKDALQNTSSGSSVFVAQKAHSHGCLCVRGSLDTAPKKA